jgi:hypothetical protein
MSVVTQLYIQIVEENNYMFRPFSGWAIIRLRLEYRRKHIYYNVDIKNGYIQIVEEHVRMCCRSVQSYVRYGSAQCQQHTSILKQYS